MRTEQITYLMMIRDWGSITKAAEKLCMTPPALSLSIKSLEEELQTTLLDRSSKGVHLTANGEYLLHIGERFMKELSLIGFDESQTKKENYHGTIDILCGQNSVDQFFPQATLLFHKQYPGIVVNPIVENIETGLSLLEKDNSVELLFCYDLWTIPHIYINPDFSRFTFHPLSTGRSYCVVSRHSNLAKQPSISYEDFSKYPRLIYKAKSYGSSYENAEENNGQATTDFSKDVITLSDRTVYNEMLRNEIGVAENVLLPFKNLHDNKEFAYLPIIGGPVHRLFQFGYFTRSNTTLSTIVELFIDFLKDYLNDQCV